MNLTYKINISAGSTIGSRDENQDNLMIDTFVSDMGSTNGDYLFYKVVTVQSEESYYFIVCDGMGGEKEGKKNSEIAVKAIYSQLKKLKKRGNAAEIVKAILEANRQVISYLERNKIKGGTTLSLLKVNGDGTMEIFNVGDSPVILVREQEMFIMSEEQNVAGMKLQNRRITKREYDHSKEKNMLLGFLGDRTWKSMTNIYYSGYVPYHNGDILMVTSDGLLSSLNKEKVLSSLQFDPDAGELIRLTKKKENSKNNDNITVIMLQILKN